LHVALSFTAGIGAYGWMGGESTGTSVSTILFTYTIGPDSGKRVNDYFTMWRSDQPNEIPPVAFRMISDFQWLDSPYTLLERVVVEYECGPGLEFGNTSCIGLRVYRFII
jgi:hypothetical protein